MTATVKKATEKDLRLRMLKARGYDNTEFGTEHETITRRLKNLWVTRNKLLGYRKEVQNTMKGLETEIKDTDARLDTIEGMIAELESKEGELIVSEHAILRYLQRYKGLDVEAICDEIRALETDAPVRRGRVIITVNPEEQNAA